MDVAQVFTELANAVNNAPVMGTTLQVTATGYAPEAPALPSFEVAEFNLTFHRTMATQAHPFGMAQMTVTCNLLLSRADDYSGQKEAQRLASPASDAVIAALEAARGAPGEDALNGACADFYVQSARGPRLIDAGDTVKFYCIEFGLFVVGD